MGAAYFKSYSTEDFYKMFLLGYKNENDFDNLMNIFGLSKIAFKGIGSNFPLIDGLSNTSYINIFITKNKNRKSTRKILGCVSLETFEQTINDYYNQISQNYNLLEITNPNYNFKLQVWQKVYSNEIISRTMQFDVGNLSRFCESCILIFLNFYSKLNKNNFLDNVKKQYYSKNISSLFVTFELAGKDDKMNSLENLFRWYKDSEEKNEQIVFEFDTKSASYRKYGEYIVGKFSFTPEKKQEIISNIQEENESSGDINIITDSHATITINSSDIEMPYLVSEWNDVYPNKSIKTGNNSYTSIDNSFTKEQKTAICSILVQLSLCDGEANLIERAKLVEIGKEKLKINLNEDREIQSLSSMMRPLNLKSLLGYLQGLNAEQKEFILVSGYEMMKADGEISNSESDFMNKVTSGLGISPAEIDAIAKKHRWYPNNQTTNVINNAKGSGCFVVLLVFIVSVMSAFIFI